VSTLLTIIPTGGDLSDRSDKTDPSDVSNHEFLIGVFGPDPGTECPIVCYVPGNPATAARKHWKGKPWNAANPDSAQDDCNAYFSLAIFKADSNGNYSRQKKDFTGLICVMFDDVGTKVTDVDRLGKLPPSWRIETSEGNFQWGYILDVPIVEPVLADALYQSIISAGLSDPGAGGPQARLARLPVGINGKTDPAFGCRLVEWQSERRYTLQEIIVGLGLELDPAALLQNGQPRGTRPDSHVDSVHTPKTAENPVVAAFKAAGLYKSPLGDGKHDVTCIWAQKHTDQIDNGSAYFEPDASFPIGGYHCFHGHCQERGIRDVLEHFAISTQEAKHRPTIYIAPGEMARIVESAEFELAQTGRHYQRGGLIVTVQTDPGSNETAIKELNPQNLALVISSIAIWMRYEGRTSSWVVTDPPVRHSRILYDLASYRHLPVLHGLARQPHLRSDGSLVTEPGYDPFSKLFGVFAAGDFDIPAQPTREDALAAVAELKSLLQEFPFKDSCDLAAALAAILTAVIRPCLPLAPMIHVRAPLIASGKSYLCNVIAAFGSPSIPSAISFPQDDEECRKLLLASLLNGPAAVIFDNLTSDLVPYKSLCSVLTEEYISGRILGVSKTATVGTRSLFLSSGNNVDPVRDMARRCVTIRLDPACEVPASRRFTSDPLAIVRQQRGRYVSLALTIIRAWIVYNGSKIPCKSLATYEKWTDWVRQPLLWLGLADPATSVFESMASDPDRETLGRLLSLWHKLLGKRPTMVRDLVKVADKHSKESDRLELHELLLDIADGRGEVDRRRLGWWIKKHANRIVDGLKIERAPGQRNADQWIVVSVQSDVSEQPPLTDDDRAVATNDGCSAADGAPLPMAATLNPDPVPVPPGGGCPIRAYASDGEPPPNAVAGSSEGGQP
jgi:hypothetical protein